MVRVERGNVVLHVMDEEARHYLQLGYNITDEAGNIIQAAIPKDVGTLQQYYVEHMKTIKVLEARVAELESQLPKVDVVDQIKAEEKTSAKRGRKKAE